MKTGIMELLPTRPRAFLIQEAARQCPLLDTGDAGWMQDRSLRALMGVAASLYKNQQRRHGGLLKLTHPMRTAHRAYNFGPKEGYERFSAAAAFIGLAHDLIEDQPFARTVESDAAMLNQIMACWRGPRAEAGSIACDIMALTDSRDLFEWSDRHDEQCARAIGTAPAEFTYTPRALVIRYLEKLDSLLGDLAYAQQQPLPARLTMQFAEMGRRNFGLIQKMPAPIGAGEKAAFERPINVLVSLAGIASRLCEGEMDGPSPA